MSAKRKYKVYKSFGKFVSIEDGVTPLLQLMYLDAPNTFLRAARHVGYRTQKRLKEEIRSGTVAGRSIKEQSFLPKSKRDAIQKRFEGDSDQLSQHYRRKKRFTGRIKSHQNLVRAIGYEKRNDRIEIGWLSRSAAKWAEMVQEGKTTVVTPKMKRYLSSIGLATNKRTIRMPRQNIIEPFFLLNKRWMLRILGERFNKKFLEEFSIGRLAS